MIFNKRDLDSKQRFSIRKLSVGVCSVLLSTLFLTFNDSQAVHATTDNNSKDATNSAVVQEDNADPTDSVKDKNSNENPAKNKITTINSQKQSDSKLSNESSNVSNQPNSVNTNSNQVTLDKKKTENNNSQHQNNENNSSAQAPSSSSEGALNDEKTQSQEARETKTVEGTSTNGQEESVKTNDPPKQNQLSAKVAEVQPTTQAKNANDKQTQNFDLKSLKSGKIDAKTLAENKAATQNIAPIPYTINDMAYAAAGSTLSNADAALFIQNAKELEAAGATIAWDGTPDTGTAQGAATEGETGSGKIKVTYKDGKSTVVDVSFMLDAQVVLSANGSSVSPNYDSPYSFYYVKNKGDKVDSLTTADSNGNFIYNAEDPDHSIINIGTSIVAQTPDPASGFTFELEAPLDTSESGIHWANVRVTEHGSAEAATSGISNFSTIPGTYTVKVPYIVEGLKVRSDIPTDSAGNPIIYAQGPTETASDGTPAGGPGFDLTDSNVNTSALGQYFYEDYATAFSLGARTQISGWSLPANGKNTTSFKMSLAGITNQPEQQVDVNYVNDLPTIDNTYIFNQNPNSNSADANYIANKTFNLNYIKSKYGSTQPNNLGKLKVGSNTISSSSMGPYILPGGGESNQWLLTNPTLNGKGLFPMQVAVYFNGFNQAGQPQIFSNSMLNGVNRIGYKLHLLTGTKQFINDVNSLTSRLFNNYNGTTITVSPTGQTMYNNIKAQAVALYPPQKTQDQVIDVSDGPADIWKTLAGSVKNPAAGTNRAAGQRPGSHQLPELDGKQQWPEGTKFEWTNKGDSEPTKLVLDKAGEVRTGDVTVILPSGTKWTVKDITISTVAKVKLKSETVDYGTKLTAADLVTNKNAFPEGTTFQFVNNSEPDWSKSGSYDTVNITATYKLTDNNGKNITVNGSATQTTPVAKCAVAINDSRTINVIQDSDVPTPEQILNLPTGWAAHTITVPHKINTSQTNQGEIDLYYPSSGLTQTIKIYVNVIPKVSPTTDKVFKTNGESITKGQPDITNGLNLVSGAAKNGDVSYEEYHKSGEAGQPSTFTKEDSTYLPTYTVSGLIKNSDGTYQSGKQTPTVTVTVPAGTFGATKTEVKKGTPGAVLDKVTGKYYTYTYTVQPTVTVEQPVKFEFVDDDDNDKVVSSQTQNFIINQEAKITPPLVIPDNYELAKGQTIPTEFTLKDGYTKADLIQKIHLVHKTGTISGNTTDKGIPDSVKKELNKDVTRTINYTGLPAKQLATIPADQKQQTAHFIGSATYDYVTQKLTSDITWSKAQILASFTPKQIDGYVYQVEGSDNDQVAAVTVNHDSTPKDVTVNYKKFDFTINVYDETAKKQIFTYNKINPQNGGYTLDMIPGDKIDGVDVENYISTGVTGVPDGVSVSGSYRVAFTDPTCQWWIPNYSWSSQQAQYALAGSTVTINVKHKTQEKQETQTRKVTVNYEKVKVNADGSYTKTGQAFAPAILEVYYTRNATTDLVTNETTYSPWLWDTKDGKDGYKVVSGDWTSLPDQYFTPVIANVPTLKGYTAYTGGPADNIDHIPANEFVYPAWNQAGEGGETDTMKAAEAYLDNAPLYEARPTHTVLYIPNETTSSTVTGKFIIAGGDRNGQEYAPDAQIQVFYSKTGTLDAKTNKIVYNGNWTFDKDGGDTDTPGFHVISGNWSSDIKTGANGGFTVIPPAGNDEYTQVTQSVHPYQDGVNYDTTQFAQPTETTYPNATDNNWFNRNTLITYYVPNSELNKTVTRTITIKEPGKADQTITQTAKLTREARVNNDDTGVVFDGFTGSGWKASQTDGSWNTQAVPAPAGYNISVTQTVDGKTTPVQLVDGQIPAVTVDGDTQDTQIVVTYGATATAKLTGNGTSVYDGQAITSADLNKAIHVTVTGPTADSGSYTLQAGDVEFSTDGQTWTTAMPTNVADYQVRLTTQGEDAIKKQFGNNSIVWQQDGKSTITNDATYKITPLASDAVMSNASEGNYSMTYNGAAPSSIDPNMFHFTATVDGKSVNLDATGLTSSDFTWVDGSAPTNVGAYQIKLNATGLAKLQKNNPNFTLTNAGHGDFTINQADASATLSGSGTRAYNGSAVTVADLNVKNSNNNITLTLHYPASGDANYVKIIELTADDFTWNTPDGKAPVNANDEAYTISLNEDAIKKIIADTVGTGQNGVNNVKFASNAISGSASYTITPQTADSVLANIENGNYTKVYDATTTNQIDSSKFQFTADGHKLNATGITGSSFEWVDAKDKPVTENPKNVGTYYIKLTDAAFTKLQAENPNYKLTNTGLGVYTITPAAATGTLTGSNSKVYDGSEISFANVNNGDNIKVDVNFPGANDQTYTLKQGDYTIANNAADVNTYTITLTSKGITNVENYIKSIAGAGQNDASNVKFDTNAITGSASFEITPSANVISVGGKQTETYKGSAYDVAYSASGNNSVTVSIAKADGNTTGALASLANVTLTSADFEITNGPAINANAEGYNVALTKAGLAKIQQALGKNYKVTNSGSVGKLIINKYLAKAEFSGDPTAPYTGNAIPDYWTKYSIKLTEPNNPTYEFKQGDLEFKVNGQWTTEAPTQVGKYDVRVAQSAWDKIKAINSANVQWNATSSTGIGTYEITQAKVTTELSGNNSMVYNGSAVTTADLYTDGSTIKVTINGTGITALPTNFTLSDGDYAWQTEDNKAPVNVGNYTIKLTKAGIDKIQAEINKAVGEGNVALTTTAANAGSANFEIKQQVASNVQLYGGEKSTYDGKPVSFNPTATEEKKNFGFNNVKGLTIPNLTSADFEWVDANGNSITAPTNVGTYYLKLNKQGEQAFANTNKNYSFVDKNGNSTIIGQITYTIDPAELVIGVAGSASKVFDNQNAKITQEQIDKGDIKLVWGDSNTEPTGLGQFTLTPDDLEVVTADGQPALHANAGIGNNGQEIKDKPYKVRLTATALEKIKKLTGANNYAISQSNKSGSYYIYAQKAELTLTGNQTTTYGIYLPFDPTAYTLDFTNWVNTPIAPKLAFKNGVLYNNGKATDIHLQAGDLYVEGYEQGGVPSNVGSYKVKISAQLIKKLEPLFPDYDFAGTADKNMASNGIDNSNQDIVEAKHEPASYVIQPAETIVTINNAEHVRYGEATTINYGGDNGYSISITAPTKPEGATTVNEKTPIYTTVKLADGDLEFVTKPDNVGKYEVKLSAQGLKKLEGLTGSKNYDWTQAASARANFYVDQMPVTIAVSGRHDVTYGSLEWLNTIKNNPSGYTLSVKTDAGAALTYKAQAGDLVFNQTPGNIGSYNVELSAQGLKNIEKALGTNYAYPQAAIDVESHGTLTVNPGEVTVTLTGSDGKTYDAKQTTASDLDLSKYSLGQVTVYSADGTKQTVSLTAGDLQIVGNATDVGSYSVELSPQGQERIKNLTGNNGDNYTWTFTTKDAHYTISAATAKANLAGSNEKTYDGSPVTTSEVNSNGQILVHFTYPGSTEQSTYTLQDGDYAWNTKDGKAPTDAGTYTITLNKDKILQDFQNTINEQAGLGQDNKSNVTISADDLSGQATFTITPKQINNVVISGNDQEKTYNGDAASLDITGLTIKADGTIADTPLVDTGITASDFDWYDVAGNKLKEAPVNVGNYEAKLKSFALETLQNANKNYRFDAANATIKYTINPAKATATLGNDGERPYDAKTTSVADVLNKLGWTATGLVNKQKLKSTDLTADDYAWFTKNADGTYTAMTGDPINAGTYYLKLKDSSLETLKQDNPNYDLTINGEFTYTINPVSGKAVLGGSASKIYDGQEISLEDLNSPNGDIEVKFTFPGSTTADTYKLQAGDYTVENNSANVGDYTVKLTDAGLAKLQRAIDNYVGKGNVTLTASDLSGNASFTIKQKDLTVTLDKKPGTNPGKTYDGKPATMDDKDAELTASGLVDGQTLNVANLTPSDYEWVDQAGNKIDTPTNAGTYYIALTPDGVKQLQKDNPNYKITESGQFAYVISPQQVGVKVSGSQESTATNIDNGKFSVDVPAGVTLPNDLTYEFTNGVPNQSGVYDVKLTPASEKALKDANPNYDLSFTSNAKFTLDATLSIVFQDTDEGNKQVGDVISKTGVAGSTIDSLGLNIPAGYKLVSDETLPSDYTFGKELKQNLFIKLAHIKKTVEHTNPIPEGEKTPTDKTIDGAHKNDLNKIITRTINVDNPDGTTNTTTQTAKIYRNATVDEVTGEVTYGKWSTGKWAAFKTPVIKDYTPSLTDVPEETVTAETENITVTITYTAIPTEGEQVIHYVDGDDGDKIVGTQIVKGKDGSDVSFKPEIPENYEPVNNVPSTVKISDGTTTIVLKHKIIQDSQTRKIIRTIIENLPSGVAKTTIQSAILTETGTKDLVTGRVEWNNDWTTGVWKKFTPTAVAGYVPSQVEVPVVEVKNGQKDVTITIDYTPVEQTGKISYQDKDGNEISTSPLKGKTGEIIPVDPTKNVPTGWKIVPNQDIPKKVTVTTEGIPTVVVKIEHKTITVTPETPKKDIPTGKVPGNPTKDYEKMESLKVTPTRTIIVTKPDGTKSVKTQTVEFTRTATFDEVTGEITYSDWNLASSSNKWAAYTPEIISGYTANPKDVIAEIVTVKTADSTIEISYVKNKVQASQVVQFIGPDNQVIASTTIIGQLGQEVSYNLPLPTNWTYTNGEPAKSVKIENGITKIAIEHKTVRVTDTRTVTETVHFKYVDQTQALPNLVKTITFTRQGVKDLVTGETTWGDWNKIKASFPEVDAIEISGYRPKPKLIEAQTVTPTSENLVFTIEYGPITIKPSNKYDNKHIPAAPAKPHKPNKSKPSESNKTNQNVKSKNKPQVSTNQQLTKKSSSETVPLYEVNDFPRGSRQLKDGRIVDAQGRVLYENGKLTRLGKDLLKKHHKRILPQTGQKDSENVSWIGALLAELGIFGLADRKKRKKKD